MSLREIEYKEDYRSGYDDIVRDVFRPSLHEARGYWRAVGYFSSSALEVFGTPLGEFIKKGGTIRLVTSVELSESDLRAIERGVSKQEVCSERLEAIIDEQFADGVGDGVARLGLLLDMGRLEIQIAMPKTGTGIYHEKIGIFLGRGTIMLRSPAPRMRAVMRSRTTENALMSFRRGSSPVRAEAETQSILKQSGKVPTRVSMSTAFPMRQRED